MILHAFTLQIIYTTVFPVRLLNRLTQKTIVYILLNSKILKQWTCIVVEKHATFLYGIHVNTRYLIAAAKLSNAGFSVANWQYLIFDIKQQLSCLMLDFLWLTDNTWYLIAAAKLSNAGFSVASSLSSSSSSSSSFALKCVVTYFQILYTVFYLVLYYAFHEMHYVYIIKKNKKKHASIVNVKQ